MQANQATTALAVILISFFMIAPNVLAAPKCDNPNKLDQLLADEYTLMVELEYAALEDRDAILAEIYAVRDDIAKFQAKIDSCLVK